MEAKLREHQAEITEIADEILHGGTKRLIVADITPGGGKSLLPVILAHKLIPKIVDKICWIVPRVTLQKQGEYSFADPEFIKLLGHNKSIRQSTNDYNPSRGHDGFVTTYQALPTGVDSLVHEFRRHRYMLFLDEPHHVSYGGKTDKYLTRLVNLAKLVVLASGTMERGDKKQIAYLNYENTLDGLQPITKNTPAQYFVKYSRITALKEKAIVPLRFSIHDGWVAYIDRKGKDREVHSFDGDNYTSDALFAALHTDYAIELLENCVKNWRNVKENIYSKAKMLVVAPNVKTANDYQSALKNMGINAPIATYIDSKKAHHNIGRFKGNEGIEVDVLVTVQMAYEGLDVKEITHLACLTQIRSKPWLEQCFARANRTDKNNGKTEAYIYGPSDPIFIEVMEQIKTEQLAIIKESDPRPEPNGNGFDEDDIRTIVDLIPLDGEVTRERQLNLEGDILTYGQTAALKDLLSDSGLIGSPIALSKVIIKSGGEIPEYHPNSNKHQAGVLVPSEREARIKERIDKLTKLIDRDHFNKDWGRTNRIIVKRFDKSRNDMSDLELRMVWAFLNRRYNIQ